MGDFWLLEYERQDAFRADINSLWLEVKPMYEELHAYVRFKLRKTYPQIEENDPLPAHVLGMCIFLLI